MGSLSLSLKVILLSTSLLFLSLCLKISVPLVHDFSVNQAPLLWSSILSWLKPPYLYVIINCIIITIVASSRFHYSHSTSNSTTTTHDQIEKIPMDEYLHDEMKISTVEIQSGHFGGLETRAEIVYQDREEEQEEAADHEQVVEDKGIVNAVAVLEDSKNETVDSSENNLLPLENLSPVEKPLVSSRFGHRKFVKASPEGGRALRVAKPKRHETLENTWKTITEGRAMPLTRHVKKSETFKDTWENHGSQFNASVVDPHEAKKSATFKDRTNYQLPLVNSSSPSSGKLRKEPSLSQDELNRRVEAFINKFNEEMRLQRQESLNQYKEMTSRGRRHGIN
ncbi:PREDICTED: uncharacterized protein LOC105138774 isoform X2 [Populus euphratica]|uniref:Uncharacterized protein LOC105138774 isoform X2 n=1 Tax=Populus euphratica TaxID=75702 RepID=A0AAJ6Y5L4_POPEU|nr:PREDICTED: uncharacterized protein LOC105138774 isoform X2 [Populus euphratica]